MVYLSLWQFNRLDDRKAFNREVTERSSQSVVDVSTLDVSDAAAVQWRPAGAKGCQLMIEYDPQPPFDSGAVDKAGPDLMERVIEYAQLRK